LDLVSFTNFHDIVTIAYLYRVNRHPGSGVYLNFLHPSEKTKLKATDVPAINNLYKQIFMTIITHISEEGHPETTDLLVRGVIDKNKDLITRLTNGSNIYFYS